MKIAFQGEPGAYSEAAIYEVYGSSVEVIPCESFENVFEAVNSGTADFGMVPIENSLAGSIHQNYDLLLENNLSIIGEHYLRIKHCLITNQGVNIEDVKKIISHPQGLAQCRNFIKSLKDVKTEPVFDTAGSVKIIKELNSLIVAAIASRQAAEKYNMKVLLEGIEDNPENFTRFLIISKQAKVPSGDSKTSIVFTLKNEPGALFKAMSVFALRDLDLTKIESRPLVGKLWEYLFYIDFAGSISDEKVRHALENLQEYAQSYRLLGSYSRHRLDIKK